MSVPRRKTRLRSRRPDDAAPVFAALGDATRLGLVKRLAGEDGLSIAELTAQTRVTRQAVTRHLEVLREAGLVRGEWSGREHVWRLERARLALARRSLDQISGWWDERLSTLKASVEG